MSLIKVNTRGQSSNLGRRNLIINGDMKVQQRYTVGTATQVVNGTVSGPDRFKFFVGGGGAYTVTQDSGHQATTGHDKAIKVAVTTADTSIAATDIYSFTHRIESNSVQHFQYGTSSAKTVTLSFWVRATKTGTQALHFAKQGTGTDYRHVKEYTINASNTWEHKTITLSGLTASTMVNDASTYFQVGWMLKYGSDYQGTKDVWTTSAHYTTAAAVNNMDSTSNTFYITGVQLEVGDTATDFENRSFVEELQLCKRYYQKSFDYVNAPANSGSATGITYGGAFLGYSGSNNEGALTAKWLFSPEMRTIPTIVRVGNSSGHWGRMSMPNSSVTYDNGAGYINNIRATGINFGQNVAGNTHICGFGHATAEAEL